MGFLDWLGLGPSSTVLVTERGLKSPWTTDGNLGSIVWEEALGADIVASLPLTRGEAIAVPAVSKARNLLVSTIAKWPLVTMRFDRGAGTDTDTTSEHSWLWRTDQVVNPYSRMVWTIDDGIFRGTSLWRVTRGTPEVEGGRRPILSAEWVPWEWWDIRDGRFWLWEGGDRTVDPVRLLPGEYIFFDFPFEGLLNVANRTLRGARAMEDAWVGRVESPIPLIDLHRTEEYNLDENEAKAMVDDWATARRSPHGAIGSTPPGIELRVPEQGSDVHLFTEGRNTIRTDVGSFLNVRASLLDGTSGIDSLTYTTKEGERNLFYEQDVPFWTDPIEARLSQDDVVPRGTRTRFAKYESQPEITGPRVED